MEYIEKHINELIENEINPALSSHGGQVELNDILLHDDTWKVSLKFAGACQGCPESTSRTLRSIEFFLREELSAPTLIVESFSEEGG